MKRKYWFLLVFVAFATLASSRTVKAQETTTLYSPLKYQHDQSRAFFDFELKQLAKRGAHWDVGYGLLYAGDDFDWFQSYGAQGDRSVIKDIGKYSWTDSFTIPVVEPLPKLKTGEQRQVTIDTSGADGAPGTRGVDGTPGMDADRILRQKTHVGESIGVNAPAEPARLKRDGKPKVDPLFVRAIVGHIYVIHVMDDSRDFYALFRVESLQSGDNCTISWKLIEPPGPTR